jgi:hypothetical protein
MQMDPAFFLALRFIIAILFGGLILGLYFLGDRNMAQGMGLAALFTVIGFVFPDLWLSGRISSRQKLVFRAMPDLGSFVGMRCATCQIALVFQR